MEVFDVDLVAAGAQFAGKELVSPDALSGLGKRPARGAKLDCLLVSSRVRCWHV
ncbi:hypothetical protein [Streptomyces cyanogenus]|uniref:hypothetical protein n=1 Tax=Streptomyces cyanogenus TaxID=80860 RepID=UPI001AA1CC1E|nr:hypothetical protein [Streptomyces cyanogenus]